MLFVKLFHTVHLHSSFSLQINGSLNRSESCICDDHTFKDLTKSLVFGIALVSHCKHKRM